MTRHIFTVLIAAAAALGQQNSPADTHEQHRKGMPAAGHHDGVNSRGDHAMGFSHEKTAHHFQLREDGGTIQVETNDARDTESRDRIREHLTHIAGMFQAGNFTMPMFIHDQAPPGVSVMKRLKKEIAYKFEPVERGGRVRIVTKNPEAVKAVHEFLRFQITDHKTGDSLDVKAGSIL